ncbi:MAG: hypothetical protein PHI65_08485, partial [Firmicutes bacterium]|nr:hypothetical protein [Bacillota bacterium]
PPKPSLQELRRMFCLVVSPPSRGAKLKQLALSREVIGGKLFASILNRKKLAFRAGFGNKPSIFCLGECVF